jgi:hypothetical protein
MPPPVNGAVPTERPEKGHTIFTLAINAFSHYTPIRRQSPPIPYFSEKRGFQGSLGLSQSFMGLIKSAFSMNLSEAKGFGGWERKLGSNSFFIASSHLW